MTRTAATSYERLVRAMPLLAAAGMVLCACVCSTTVARWFDSEPPLAPRLVSAIRDSQAAFALAAVLLTLLGLALRYHQPTSRLLRHPTAQRALLATLLTTVPLFAIEFGFRPLARSRTPVIYTVDEHRGWKHRPNTMDFLAHTPVTINGLGLRGPEVSPTKPPNVYRILFLGDSVTFGVGIADDGDTIAQRVAEHLAKTSMRAVETVNAGVCGYSPWQEHHYLQNEGLSLAPDMVVTNFVLNDVTEKFNLPQFGGTTPNMELVHASASQLPPWLAHSGLHFVAKTIAAHYRFGRSPHKTATLTEALGVKTLCTRPDDPTVQYAWRVTLENVEKIRRTAASAGAANLLVVYPYAFQLDAGQSTIPQQVVLEYARTHDLPALDLLPLFRSAIQSGRYTTKELFADFSHPTPAGAMLAAEAIAEFIEGMRVFPRHVTRTADTTRDGT